ENGSETLRACFHGSVEIDGPGAFTGACSTTSLLREERRERTVTRAVSRRPFRTAFRHSLHLRDRPSDVRRSARYEDVGYSTPQSAQVFTIAPFSQVTALRSRRPERRHPPHVPRS